MFLPLRSFVFASPALHSHRNLSRGAFPQELVFFSKAFYLFHLSPTSFSLIPNPFSPLFFLITFYVFRFTLSSSIILNPSSISPLLFLITFYVLFLTYPFPLFPFTLNYFLITFFLLRFTFYIFPFPSPFSHITCNSFLVTSPSGNWY